MGSYLNIELGLALAPNVGHNFHYSPHTDSLASLMALVTAFELQL